MNTIEKIVIQNIQKNEQKQPYFIVELFLERNEKAIITFFLYLYERKEENGRTRKHYMLQEKIDAPRSDDVKKAKLMANYYKNLQRDRRKREKVEKQKQRLIDFAERIIEKNQV